MKEILQSELRARLDSLEADSLPLLNCKYQLLTTLGEGAFGKVKLAMHVRTRQFFAVKLLKKHCDSAAFEAFLKEITALKKFSKERFAPKLRDFSFSGSLVKRRRRFTVAFYATDFVFPGEMFKLVEAGRQLSFAVVLHFYKQLLLNLERLKKAGMLHCDLKMENLLLDEKLNVLFCDFGAAREALDFRPDERMGTREYSAPELNTFRGRRPPSGFDPLKLELFSVGVILHVLIFHKFPRFDAKSGALLADLSNLRDERSRAFVDAHLRKLLDRDFRKRLGFEEVKKLAFGLECESTKAELAVLGREFQERAAAEVLSAFDKVSKKLLMKKKIFGLCATTGKTKGEQVADFYCPREIKQFLRDYGPDIAELEGAELSRDSFLSNTSRNSHNSSDRF